MADRGHPRSRGVRPKLVAAASGSLVFLLGWFASEGLDASRDYFFPDTYEVRADAVRAELQRKSDSISEIVTSMRSDLDALREGAGEDGAAQALVARAEALIEEATALRPAVAEAADLSAALDSAVQAGKRRALAAQGFSREVDFALGYDEGATVCPERFAFGIWSASNGNLRAQLSRDAETTTVADLSPGQAVTVAGRDSAATVRYVGIVGRPEEASQRFGFDVACDPL
jgi:hypothetical protein